MKSLKTSDPLILKELEDGNWVVRQCTTPFCALGADETIEHQNRAMKVMGALVVSTQHPTALAGYFFTAPMLDEISENVSSTAEVSAKQERVQKPHYEYKNELNRENNATRKLSTELK